MNWQTSIHDFSHYQRLEKNLSVNTVKNYQLDLAALRDWCESDGLKPLDVQLNHLEAFLGKRQKEGLKPRSQARLVSSLRSFFKFLVLDGHRKDNPARLLERPKTGRKLPVYLEPGEIDQMIEALDLSHPQGERNRAMLELLFSCGLRVSELTGLKMADLRLEEGIIRVTGKGNKQRLVPISKTAIRYLTLYMEGVRRHQSIQKGEEIYVFLNRNGKHLTRAMIFTIVRQTAEKAGIHKAIGPHTFRHSFATALVNNDADLRSIQEMLGHASILTTEIYAHLKDEKVRDAISKHPLKRRT